MMSVSWLEFTNRKRYYILSKKHQEEKRNMQTAFLGDILGLGTPELVIILIILLVLFGGSQLPKLARSLGSSAKELRKGLDDAKGEAKNKDSDKKAGK